MHQFALMPRLLKQKEHNLILNWSNCEIDGCCLIGKTHTQLVWSLEIQPFGGKPPNILNSKPHFSKCLLSIPYLMVVLTFFFFLNPTTILSDFFPFLCHSWGHNQQRVFRLLQLCPLMFCGPQGRDDACCQRAQSPLLSSPKNYVLTAAFRALWTSLCIPAQAFGHLGIWASGHPGIWAFRYLGIRASRNLAVAAGLCFIAHWIQNPSPAWKGFRMQRLGSR